MFCNSICDLWDFQKITLNCCFTTARFSSEGKFQGSSTQCPRLGQELCCFIPTDAYKVQHILSFSQLHTLLPSFCYLWSSKMKPPVRQTWHKELLLHCCCFSSPCSRNSCSNTLENDKWYPKACQQNSFPFCNSQLDLGNRSGYHVTVTHCFVLCQVS